MNDLTSTEWAILSVTMGLFGLDALIRGLWASFRRTIVMEYEFYHKLFTIGFIITLIYTSDVDWLRNRIMMATSVFGGLLLIIVIYDEWWHKLLFVLNTKREHIMNCVAETLSNNSLEYYLINSKYCLKEFDASIVVERFFPDIYHTIRVVGAHRIPHHRKFIKDIRANLASNAPGTILGKLSLLTIGIVLLCFAVFCLQGVKL